MARGDRSPKVKPTTAPQAPLPGKVAALLRESRWFVLIAAALYVSLILVSFDKADPGWSHAAPTDQIRNAGGHVGAWLADVLLYIFGLSAYWLVALLLYIVVWGYRRLDGESISDRRSLLIAGAGFLLVIAATSGIEAVRMY
jgi:S-DNA-T family DNA segregation ATPase FtsK/SpoIIIE